MDLFSLHSVLQLTYSLGYPSVLLIMIFFFLIFCHEILSDTKCLQTLELVDDGLVHLMVLVDDPG